MYVLLHRMLHRTSQLVEEFSVSTPQPYNHPVFVCGTVCSSPISLGIRRANISTCNYDMDGVSPRVGLIWQIVAGGGWLDCSGRVFLSLHEPQLHGTDDCG